VVPIITAVIAVGDVSAMASTRRRTALIPVLTSAVVGDLHAARITAPSINAASVFVPPTSMPIRMRPSIPQFHEATTWASP
jgi:hypothetical protein